MIAANLSLRRELDELRSGMTVERADLEQQLATAIAARDHARSALDRKAEALAHMSHELRTPMNGILGMTRLALQTDLSQEQRDYLNVVNASADSLLTLINDILDLSKLDAGRLTLETIPFDLRDSVANSVKSIATLIEDKGLTMKVGISEDVPAVVIGDPGRLRQVLLNLVSNAVRFSDQGAVNVEVSARSMSDETVELHFQVIDNGIGIPPDRIATIFEPYVQAGDSTAREYGGTGLGLAICRDLVDLMQGEIWVESAEDKGSTFHFTAQFGSTAAADDEALAAIDELTSLAVCVLAAEAPSSGLAEQLEAAGIRASTFDRSDRFLEAIAEHGPDMAVVDLDHFELEIAESIPKEVTTIVVTSSGQRGDAARCRELNVAAYLTRPFGPLDLRDAVRAVLGRADYTLITRHWLREHRPRLRVLAADDSASNRLIITQMLELQEHDVVTVSNGKEAVEAFGSDQFDVVLMDMEMPNMGGTEAARVLRRAGAEVPIIALTGNTSPEQIEECLAAGMTGHLSKPFEFNELIDLIEGVVKAA